MHSEQEATRFWHTKLVVFCSVLFRSVLFCSPRACSDGTCLCVCQRGWVMHPARRVTWALPCVIAIVLVVGAGQCDGALRCTAQRSTSIVLAFDRVTHSDWHQVSEPLHCTRCCRCASASAQLHRSLLSCTHPPVHSFAHKFMHDRVADSDCHHVSVPCAHCTAARLESNFVAACAELLLLVSCTRSHWRPSPTHAIHSCVHSVVHSRFHSRNLVV